MATEIKDIQEFMQIIESMPGVLKADVKPADIQKRIVEVSLLFEPAPTHIEINLTIDKTGRAIDG